MSDSTSTLKHRLKKRLTEDIRDYLYCEVTRMLMFLGLKSTGSHGRIIRLVLQPHLKRVGMDWEDVDSLLKDLREDDLKKCSKTGNLGPILQNILPRMAVTHRDAAKKLMVAHLQRLLLPQLEKTCLLAFSVGQRTPDQKIDFWSRASCNTAATQAHESTFAVPPTFCTHRPSYGSCGHFHSGQT